MDRKSLEAPIFFPSASRVKIPFVGDDTRHVKPVISNLSPITNPLERHQKHVESNMLKQVSQFVDFGFDVVKDRCSYTLPYDEEEAAKAYDWSDLVPTTPRPSNYGGRFIGRGYQQKALSQFKMIHSPNAARLKTKFRTVTERHGNIPPLPLSCSTKPCESVTSEHSRTSIKAAKMPSSVPTLVGSAEKQKTRKSVPAEWDEVLLNKLSKDTAQWIVAENTETVLQKERLDNLLKYKFGPKVSSTALVRDNVTVSIFSLTWFVSVYTVVSGSKEAYQRS